MVPPGTEKGVNVTDDTAARIAALKAKGEAEAEQAKKPREETINWNQNLQEGDMIAGVMERGAIVNMDDGPRHLMEIRDHETGDLYTVWCSSFMLREAVIEKAPKVGSLVVVEFHGKQPSQKDPSRSFNLFTLEAEESDFEYWAELSRQAFSAKATVQAAPTPSFGPDEAPF